MHLSPRLLIATGAIATSIASGPIRADDDPQLLHRLRAPVPPLEAANDSGFDIAGNCRKLREGVIVRKSCRGTLSFDRDIAPGVTFHAQASLGRERGRSSGPVELGRPGAEYMRDFAAALTFAGGWHLGAGYFDHDGWNARSFADMARQMGGGGDPARRGSTLSLGWSRPAHPGTPNSLSVTLLASREQEADPASPSPSPRNGTAVRLALDTSF